MTTSKILLTDPEKGLIPYLDSKLGVAWANRVIKPYSFGSANNLSGYRIGRSLSTREVSPGRSLATGNILLGRMIQLSDSVDQCDVVDGFGTAIDTHIRHWSRCAPGIAGDIESIGGSITISRDSNVPSSAPGYQWAIVIRDFQLTWNC